MWQGWELRETLWGFFCQTSVWREWSGVTTPLHSMLIQAVCKRWQSQKLRDILHIFHRLMDMDPLRLCSSQTAIGMLLLDRLGLCFYLYRLLSGRCGKCLCRWYEWWYKCQNIAHQPWGLDVGIAAETLEFTSRLCYITWVMHCRHVGLRFIGLKTSLSSKKWAATSLLLNNISKTTAVLKST